MTEQDKQLLLQDLCARLPYGVIASCAEGTVMGVHWNKLKLDASLLFELQDNDALSNVKPYLRSMSSMTDEECKELGELPITINNIGVTLPNTPYYIEVVKVGHIKWLLKNHFDFMGLIPKGLAIEVTESNNPYERID